MDVRVSRNSLRLEPGKGGYLLLRGSSRLRVDGLEVGDSTFLSDQRLQDGVVLLIAHCVVLHLRLGEMADASVLSAPSPPGLLGVSAAMRRVFLAIEQAARSDGDVLLLGPTGTGKDVAARAIHSASARSEQPWVAVNMSALPPELAAAALFGSRRGAFTGADQHRSGYFQRAAGGTLFLDEIGDASPAVQALLLRALQERELQVVGGGIERVELRVIAATEHAPDGQGNALRGALRHRLGAREVELPALAARREDIGLLAASLLVASATERGEVWDVGGDCDRTLASWAHCFEGLLCHPLPGNVRQLQNHVLRLASDGGVCLSDIRESHALSAAVGRNTTESGVAESSSSGRSLNDYSDSEFLAKWEESRFEVARMARMLGVSRQAVYRRVQRLDQCRLASDVPLAELLATLEACRGDLGRTARHLAVSQPGLKVRLRAAAPITRDSSRAVSSAAGRLTAP